jgi:hypothetical protein
MQYMAEEGSKVAEESELHLRTAARLLRLGIADSSGGGGGGGGGGCGGNDGGVASMVQAFCTRAIVTKEGVVAVQLDPEQACQCRDAMAKAIYQRLFLWIVKRVNGAIKATVDVPVSFIGVLDIFGFERFSVNGFEQFCINYANEALQQQFNEFVFKVEQEEYEREGIKWYVAALSTVTQLSLLCC